MPVITGEVLLGRSPVYSIPIFFLKKKIKLGIEGDLTSYLYDVLPLGPPFTINRVGPKDIMIRRDC